MSHALRVARRSPAAPRAYQPCEYAESLSLAIEPFSPHLGEAPCDPRRAVLCCAGLLRRKVMLCSVLATEPAACPPAARRRPKAAPPSTHTRASRFWRLHRRRRPRRRKHRRLHSRRLHRQRLHLRRSRPLTTSPVNPAGFKDSNHRGLPVHSRATAPASTRTPHPSTNPNPKVGDHNRTERHFSPKQPRTTQHRTPGGARNVT